MSGRFATGSAPSRTPRGPAKVLRLPTPTLVRRRRAIKAGMSLLAISLATAIAARIYLLRTSPPSPEEIAGLSDAEAGVIRAANEARAQAGLRALRFSPQLAVIARGHSYDMAIRNYLSQQTPEGASAADRVRGIGIEGRQVAEAIYLDTRADLEGLGQRAVAAWMNDAATRAEILSPQLTETGVGIARAANGRIYLTQDSSN
ncbi:MAG TPA: CAP domain-containing protein [Candidatus Binataceae bacterium]|nr:CAP domain-containing protein [Candidatus Binataceae bacterium]